jgi:DNA gyrase/topoisomerase IV subunit B
MQQFGNDDGPKFQNLRQVTIDSLPEADRVFSMLMGDEVPPREFIEKTLFTQILMPINIRIN